MIQRTVVVAALATTLLLAGAAAGDPGSDKARVEARIGDLKAQAQRAVGTEAVRTTELSAIASRVRAAESAVTTSFADLLDNLELLNRIGEQDERIATSLDRTRTELLQTRVATERAARDGIVANRDALAVAERNKARALATVRQDRASFVAEADGLAATEMSLSSTTVTVPQPLTPTIRA